MILIKYGTYRSGPKNRLHQFTTEPFAEVRESVKSLANGDVRLGCRFTGVPMRHARLRRHYPGWMRLDECLLGKSR